MSGLSSHAYRKFHALSSQKAEFNLNMDDPDLNALVSNQRDIMSGIEQLAGGLADLTKAIESMQHGGDGTTRWV